LSQYEEAIFARGKQAVVSSKSKAVVFLLKRGKTTAALTASGGWIHGIIS